MAKTKLTATQKKLSEFAKNNYAASHGVHTVDAKKDLALDLQSHLSDVLLEPDNISVSLLSEIPFLVKTMNYQLWTGNTAQQQEKIMSTPLFTPENYNQFTKNYFAALTHTNPTMYNHTRSDKKGFMDGSKTTTYSAITALQNPVFGTMDAKLLVELPKHQANYMINYPDAAGLGEFNNPKLRFDEENTLLFSTLSKCVDQTGWGKGIEQVNEQDRIFYSGNLGFGTQNGFFLAYFTKNGGLSRALLYHQMPVHYMKSHENQFKGPVCHPGRVIKNIKHWMDNKETPQSRLWNDAINNMNAFSDRIKSGKEIKLDCPLVA